MTRTLKKLKYIWTILRQETIGSTKWEFLKVGKQGELYGCPSLLPGARVQATVQETEIKSGVGAVSWEDSYQSSGRSRMRVYRAEEPSGRNKQERAWESAEGSP